MRQRPFRAGTVRFQVFPFATPYTKYNTYSVDNPRYVVENYSLHYNCDARRHSLPITPYRRAVGNLPCEDITPLGLEPWPVPSAQLRSPMNQVSSLGRHLYRPSNPPCPAMTSSLSASLNICEQHLTQIPPSSLKHRFFDGEMTPRDGVSPKLPGPSPR
jgi:hypothetical protein